MMYVGILATRFSAILMMMAAASPVVAADGSSLTGVGAATCTDFYQGYMAIPQVEDSYFAWAEGFMSGLNSMMSADKQPTRDLSAMTMDAEKAYLRDYCSSHSADTYPSAVAKLFFSLKQVPARTQAPH